MCIRDRALAPLPEQSECQFSSLPLLTGRCSCPLRIIVTLVSTSMVSCPFVSLLVPVTSSFCTVQSICPRAISSASCMTEAVSYTHLRAHETVLDLVCRLLLEKKKLNQHQQQL